MSLIKVSPYSSLNFNQDWTDMYQRPVGYRQPFLPSDTILIQFWRPSASNPMRGILINRDTGDATVYLATEVNADTEGIYSEIEIAGLPEGNYRFNIIDSVSEKIQESSYFYVCDQLEDTVLLKYTNDKNEFDTIFNTGKVFSFRVEASFPPNGRQFLVEANSFRDQNYEEHLLSAYPYEPFAFSVGGRHGVPNWVARKLNHIFCLSYVSIDGKICERSEGSAVEQTEYISNYPLFNYRINLEQKRDIYISVASPISVISYGQSFAVALSTNDLGWTATSGDSWITIWSPGGNPGDPLMLTVNTNNGVARVGYVTLTSTPTGVTTVLEIRQGGARDVYISSPTPVNLAGAAQVHLQNVLTNDTGWTASTDATWITIGPTSGTDLLTITVTDNPGSSPRTGIINLVSRPNGATDTVEVIQAQANTIAINGHIARSSGPVYVPVAGEAIRVEAYPSLAGRPGNGVLLGTAVTDSRGNFQIISNIPESEYNRYAGGFGIYIEGYDHYEYLTAPTYEEALRNGIWFSVLLTTQPVKVSIAGMIMRRLDVGGVSMPLSNAMIQFVGYGSLGTATILQEITTGSMGDYRFSFNLTESQYNTFTRGFAILVPRYNHSHAMTPTYAQMRSGISNENYTVIYSTAPFINTETRVELSGVAQRHAQRVYTNQSSWTATTSSDWISLTESTGPSGGNLTFEVAQNGTDDRTGTITLTSSPNATTVTVTVFQQASEAIYVNTPTPVNAGSTEWTINDYVITNDESWAIDEDGISDPEGMIEVMPRTSGVSGDEYEIDLTANRSTNERRAYVPIVSSPNGARMTLEIIQEGEPIYVTTESPITISAEGGIISKPVYTNWPYGWQFADGDVPEGMFLDLNPAFGESGEPYTLVVAENLTGNERRGKLILSPFGGAGEGDFFTLEIIQERRQPSGFIPDNGTTVGVFEQKDPSKNNDTIFTRQWFFDSMTAADPNKVMGLNQRIQNNPDDITMQLTTAFTPFIRGFGVSRALSVATGITSVIGIFDPVNLTVQLRANGRMSAIQAGTSMFDTKTAPIILGALVRTGSYASNFPTFGLREFNRALTEEEMAQLENSGRPDLVGHTTIEGCTLELIPENLYISDNPAEGIWKDTSGNGNDFQQVGNPSYYFAPDNPSTDRILDTGIFYTDIASAAKTLSIPAGYVLTDVTVFNYNSASLTAVNVALAGGQAIVSDQTVTFARPRLFVPTPGVSYSADATTTITVTAAGNTTEGGMKIKATCKFIGR